MCGTTVQNAKPEDTSQQLSPSEKTVHPRSNRNLPLLAIASAQAKPTDETITRCKPFLDYPATHQDTILTYKASDMVLVVHSDASYLSEPKARNQAGGCFFLSSDCDNPANNGAVLNLAQLIKDVMSSTAEAELGALYINAREAVPQGGKQKWILINDTKRLTKLR